MPMMATRQRRMEGSTSSARRKAPYRRDRPCRLRSTRCFSAMRASHTSATRTQLRKMTVHSCSRISPPSARCLCNKLRPASSPSSSASSSCIAYLSTSVFLYEKSAPLFMNSRGLAPVACFVLVSHSRCLEGTRFPSRQGHALYLDTLKPLRAMSGSSSSFSLSRSLFPFECWSLRS